MGKEYTKEQIIQETWEHILDVMCATVKVKDALTIRAVDHDRDKLIPENTQILADALNSGKWEEWNKIHMEKQRHHIEWMFNNLNQSGCNLFDLIESVIDGVTANYRRNGGNATYESQFAFYKRKGFDDTLATILANTFMEIHEMFVESFKESETL